MREVSRLSRGRKFLDEKKTELKALLLWRQGPCMFPGHKRDHFSPASWIWDCVPVDLAGLRAACAPVHLPHTVLSALSESPGSVCSPAVHCRPWVPLSCLWDRPLLPQPLPRAPVLCSPALGPVSPLLLHWWKESNKTNLAGL